MANKKISELQTRTPSLTDLILVGDPSNGFSYKCTVSALATIIETDIADGYVTLGTTQTISGAKTFSNNLTLTSVANASTDPDKFLVLNGSNVVNYRTGSEVLSDIGGQGTITLTTTGTSGAATFAANTLNIPQYQGVITLTTTGTSGAATLVGNTLNIPNYAPDLSGYVPTSRTITINGTTQDLTANRTYNVGTVTSVAASGGTGISISGSPITSSGTITITNTAPDQVVALTAGTGISISGTYPNFTITNSSPSLGGTVTSVALSAPTGFAVTGSPITSSGTLALAFATGYSLPTTASQTNWDSAYNNMIVSAAVTGTTTKTLTLTQQDAGTITASWTDDNTDAVTSVFGRTGAVVAVNGDYNTSQVTESTNLYFTDARARGALSAGTGISYSTTTGVIASTITQYTDAMARAAISLTTTGSSGSATYSNTTGVLNIPTYTLAGLGGISLTSLSAFVPLIYNNTTGQFSITQSNSTNDGYLSATDWNTFNNKQATITLTTTGTSGAATFTSNTLNIPQYQGALTLTTTGTSGAATLVGNTLNIPQYSGGGGSVSGTTNYIAKFTSSTAVGNSLLFDNGSNIGVAVTPSSWDSAFSAIQLYGVSIYSVTSDRGNNGFVTNGYWDISDNRWEYIGAGTASNYQQFSGGHIWYTSTGTGTANAAISFTTAMTLNSSANLGLGTATIGSRLQVNGNAAIGYSASTAAPTNGLAVAGNVGIGIAAAATNLHVYRTTAGLSGMQVSNLTHGSTVTDGMFVGVDDTQGYIYMYENLPIQLSTNSTVRLFINNDGTVFVGGTNAPASPTTGILSGSGATGTNVAGAELRIRGGASTGSAAGGPITFYTSAAGTAGTGVNAAVERMRLSTSLQVGSSTTSVNTVMFINSSATTASTFNSTLALVNKNATSGALNGIMFSNSGEFGSAAIYTTQTNTTNNGDNIVLTTKQSNGSGNWNTGVIINTSGSLGVGTSTIGSALQVNGGAAIGYSASTAAPTNGLAVAGSVGVGTNTAADMVTVGTTTTGGNVRVVSSGYGSTGIFRAFGTDGNEKLQMGGLANTQAYIYTPASVDLLLFTGAAERVRLNASGVFFIGNGETNASPSTGIISGTGGTGTNIAGAEFRIRGGASTGNAAGGPITFYTSAAGSAGTGVNAATERMRIDTRGNLGLGGTPSAWDNTWNVLQLSSFGSLSIGLQSLYFTSNTFYNGTNWIYQGVNQFGLVYELNRSNGSFVWYSAPAGASGSSATYTQIMTLTTGGNLGIGTNTIGSKLQVNGNAAIGYSASTAAPTNGLIVAGNAYFGGQIAALTDVMQLRGSSNVLIAMQSTVNTQFSGMNLYNEAGTLAASFALGNSNTGSFSNHFFLGPRTASGNLLFVTGASGTTRMTMTTNGELQFTPATNTSVLSTTGAYSLTGSNASSLIDLAGTWNTTGNPTAIKLNITNTASGTGADLMELQVGGVNQFLVTKAGNISLGGSITTDTPTGGTKKAWKLGSVVVTGSWVIDSSRYVEVEIDGTAYKLALAIAP